MASRIGTALRHSLAFTHLAGRGKLAIWALASLAVLQVAQVQAAPPIEALQRSIQQRWEASNNNSQGLPTTFPARSDGTIAPALPQDGFYGSDLDDPDKLKALVDDISGKVTALAGAYTWDGVKLDDNVSVLTLSPGGSWVVNFSSLTKVGTMLQVLPSNAPIDVRIAQCEEILRHCKNVPLRLTFNPVNPPTRNADGSWTPGSPAPALAYVKSVSAGVQPPAPGAAYGDAKAKWAFTAKLPDGNVINRLDSGSLFSASSADTLQGTGIYPDPMEVQYLGGGMGQLCRYVGEDAHGTLKFYFSVDNNSELSPPPVPPNPELLPSTNGPLHLWDSKSGSGNLVCKEVGDDVPALVIRAGAGWNVRWAAGMFSGDFRDEWDTQCAGCACTQGGVTDSGGTGGDLTGQSSGASGGGGSASAGGSGMNFIMGLGGDTFGAIGGSISLHSDQPIPDLINPNTFKYSVGPNGQVIRVNGVATQVLTPSSLVQVAALGPNKLTLKQYPAPTVPKQADGTYPVGGTPLRTVTIQKPVDPKTNQIDPNSVRITVESGSRVDVYAYQYIPATGAWKYSQGDGASVTYLTPIWNGAHTQRTEWRQTYSADGVLESESANIFQTEPWGEALVASIADPNGAALTTTYSYYEDPAQTGKYGQFKQMVDANGYWQTYDYDQYGRRVKVMAQYGDSAVASGDGTNRVVTTTYANANPTVTEVETTLGAETKRSYRAYFTNETRDIVCTVPGAAWTAATNLVTVTKTVTGGPFSGQVQSVLQANGILTTYSYQLSPDGNTKTITKATGQPNAAGDTVVVGTRTITVVDRAGQEVSVTEVDIASGLTLTSETRTAVDDLGRPTDFVYEDGTTMSTGIGCCGPETATDRQGVVTTYEYDALGLVHSMTSDGLTTITEHDSLGREIRVSRQGTDGTIQMLGEAHYDLAGRVFQTVGPLNRSTTVSETHDGNGYRVRATTNPDGSTKIETFRKDGKQLSVGGIAARPLSFEYGVEDYTPSGGSLVHAQFTKTIRVGALGATTEWIKTYQDMTGRVCGELQSNGGVLSYAFNPQGQLIKTIDPDGVTTLYTYGPTGEIETTAVDMGANGTAGNGVIDFAGSDRITKTVKSVVSAHGVTVQRITTLQWNVAGVNSAITPSQVDSTPNGRHVWNTGYGLTTETLISLNGDGTRTSTTTFPDNSILIEQRDHERLISSARKDATGSQIRGTTYLYNDSFKRLTSAVDAQNGTTAYSYYDDDQIRSMTTPAPEAGSPAQMTSYFYEPASGRLQRVQHPDGGVVYREYWSTGDLKKTLGVRTYPVEYTYDPQGRMKTLTTHGAAGAATTIWNYNAISGFLTSKQYAGEDGPNAAYTLAGRLSSRTWVRGTATSYDRDAAGDVSGIGYSDGTTPAVGLSRNRLGQAVLVTDAAGTRILSPTADGQSGNESYSDGTFTGTGINRGYDGLLRPGGVTLALGAQNLATTYGYDDASRLKTVTGDGAAATYYYVPNSSLVDHISVSSAGQARMTASRIYDNINRLKSISATLAGQQAPVAAFAYGYDSANQRVSATMADASHWEYGYDLFGQVTSASKRWSDGTAVTGQQFGYQFDAIGNRTSAATSGRNALYAPNILNQYGHRNVPGTVDILGTAAPSATVTVNGTVAQRHGAYFAGTVTADNSTSAAYPKVDASASLPNGNPAIGDLTVDKSGHAYLAATPEQFTYDSDGNLTDDGRWHYTWDGENRLIAMESQMPAVTVGAPKQRLEFAYDGQSRRFRKKVLAWNVSTNTWQLTTEIRFLYDGSNLIAELDGSNNLLRTYLWGLDLSGTLYGAGGVGGLLEESQYSVAGQTSYLPSYDGNGNIVAFSNAADGSLETQYEYGPFGEPTRSSQPTSFHSFRFSTKYFDTETKLSYFGYRYYSEDLGRWVNRDPIAEQGGENLYAMVYNDPIGRADYLGWAETSLRTTDKACTVILYLGHTGEGAQYSADLMNAVYSAPCQSVAGGLISCPQMTPHRGIDSGISQFGSSNPVGYDDRGKIPGFPQESGDFIGSYDLGHAQELSDGTGVPLIPARNYGRTPTPQGLGFSVYAQSIGFAKLTQEAWRAVLKRANDMAGEKKACCPIVKAVFRSGPNPPVNVGLAYEQAQGNGARGIEKKLLEKMWVKPRDITKADYPNLDTDPPAPTVDLLSDLPAVNAEIWFKAKRN